MAREMDDTCGPCIKLTGKTTFKGSPRHIARCMNGAKDAYETALGFLIKMSETRPDRELAKDLAACLGCSEKTLKKLIDVISEEEVEG
jgi:hypothetical protein